jgi:hypothetical protein
MADEINKNLANSLLFEDPETGEELRPEGLPVSENGLMVVIASNKSRSRRWKHSIKTEEI